MRRWLWVGLLVVAAVAAGAFVAPGTASTTREDQMRAEIAQYLNDERANRGLTPLGLDSGLQDSAQAWAEQNRSGSCQADCHDRHADAEILAWGGPNSPSGAFVVAWMKSAGHRNIALDSQATSFGVGFACADSGTVYTSVQYADVRKPVVSDTGEEPIATSKAEGSHCEADAAPRGQSETPPATSAPTTTSPTRAPTTTPPAAAPPPASAPPTAPLTSTTPAALVTVAAPVTTTSAPSSLSTSTSAAPIRLSANGPRLTGAESALDDGLLVESASRPPRAEAAWISMLVVVVLLSALRVAGELRKRSNESAARGGL